MHHQSIRKVESNYVRMVLMNIYKGKVNLSIRDIYSYPWNSTLQKMNYYFVEEVCHCFIFNMIGYIKDVKSLINFSSIIMYLRLTLISIYSRVLSNFNHTFIISWIHFGWQNSDILITTNSNWIVEINTLEFIRRHFSLLR